MNLASSILDVLAAAPPRLTFAFRDARGTESMGGALMAGRIAGFARAFSGAGLERGTVTPILAPSSTRLWAAFVGAMAADLIPCILPIPTFKTHMPIYARNLARLLERYHTRVVLVDGEVAPLFQAVSGVTDSLELRDLAAFDRPAPGWNPSPSFGDDDVAFLQHSSGSTGVPKGVALSHRAVLGHIAEYAAAIRLDPGQDAVLSWLPLYHDMGLLTSFLMPLVCGVPCHTLRPQDWILDPPGLLSLITETRATLAWWPNFAFPLLAQRTRPSTRETLDLASLRLLVNCSEPVLARSHDEFRATFEGCGLGPDVLHTCYAMAECVIAVSQSVGTGPRRLAVRRDSHGQLSSALSAFEELGTGDQPVASLTKKDELILVPGRAEPIALPRYSPVVPFVQRVRDEAHRFAIGFHCKTCSARPLRSELDDIPGVGPTKRRALLSRFGSVRGLRGASEAELVTVLGTATATRCRPTSAKRAEPRRRAEDR